MALHLSPTSPTSCASSSSSSFEIPIIYNSYEENHKALLEECKKNSYEAVRATLKMNHYIDPAYNDNELVCTAAEFGRREIMQILLDDKRVNPRVKDDRPFSLAAQNDHIDVVKMLLEYIKKIFFGSFTQAMRSAVKNGAVHFVEKALDKEYDSYLTFSTASNVDFEKKEAVRQGFEDTVKDGNISIVQKLLSHEKIRSCLSMENAFYIVIENGKIDMLKLLLAINTAQLIDPFKYAAISGHVESVKLLAKDPRVTKDDIDQAIDERQQLVQMQDDPIITELMQIKASKK